MKADTSKIEKKIAELTTLRNELAIEIRRLSWDSQQCQDRLRVCNEYGERLERLYEQLEASKKPSFTTSGSLGTATFNLRTNEHGEIRVKFFSPSGQRLPDCDYFTSDLDDAIATARLMVESSPIEFVS